MLTRALAVALVLSGCAPASRLVVIRHGEAEHNVAGTLNSRTSSAPSHLTPLGRAQVAASARDIAAAGVRGNSVSIILYSPLARTQETAEILARELAVPIARLAPDSRIVEIDMGRLEGRRIDEVREHFPGGDSWDHSLARAYGGETEADVAARLAPLLADLRGGRYRGDVIVVTHGTPAEVLLGLACELRRSRAHFRNAEFVVLLLRDLHCAGRDW